MSITEILPEHEQPADLGSWARQLVAEFPNHDEFDLAALIEERSGKRVRKAELEIIRAVYLRSRFQIVQPEEDDE